MVRLHYNKELWRTRRKKPRIDSMNVGQGILYCNPTPIHKFTNIFVDTTQQEEQLYIFHKSHTKNSYRRLTASHDLKVWYQDFRNTHKSFNINPFGQINCYANRQRAKNNSCYQIVPVSWFGYVQMTRQFCRLPGFKQTVVIRCILGISGALNTGSSGIVVSWNTNSTQLAHVSLDTWTVVWAQTRQRPIRTPGFEFKSDKQWLHAKVTNRRRRYGVLYKQRRRGSFDRHSPISRQWG